MTHINSKQIKNKLLNTTETERETEPRKANRTKNRYKGTDTEAHEKRI